jgi:hypothetical protein
MAKPMRLLAKLAGLCGAPGAEVAAVLTADKLELHQQC